MENVFEWLEDDEREELLDDMILAIGEIAREEDSKTAIIAPTKMQQMNFVHSVAKFITKNQNAKVTYTLNKPYKSMGNVTIEGDNLILSGKWFSRAAEFANNTEIYPLVNGKIRITFTFHGLTMPIE